MKFSLSFTEIEKAEKIIANHALASGFSFDEIIGKRRFLEVTRVRHQAMRDIAKQTSLSMVIIGGLFNRDHSSVVYALKGLKRSRLPKRGMTQGVAEVECIY